jgi:DNA uptake protein ComE-like DNA-binding protein
MKLPKKLRRLIKPFFTLNRSEQKGILVLSFLILLMTAFKFFLPFMLTHETVRDKQFEKEVRLFLERQKALKDSIQLEKLQNQGMLDHERAAQKLRPFPFDPNNLDKEGWLRLGLTKKQAGMILKYRSNGGAFKKKADFAKIYCISEVEFALLEPYIELQPERQNKPSVKGSHIREKSFYTRVNLNSADSAELRKSLLLSGWLAQRVIRYRELLGGYAFFEQLHEVYGFDSIEVNLRKSYIVVDSANLNKLNLNTATFKQILRHPYISYELTKHIVNTREEKGSVQVNDLTGNPQLITEEKLERLLPYVSFERP